MLYRLRLTFISISLLVIAGCAADSTSLSGVSLQSKATSESIHWLLELELDPVRVADFKILMSEMVAFSETQPGTLVYEWYFNEDNSRCIINERYRDSAALIDHMTASGGYAERFLAAATISRLTILGDVDSATRAALAGLDPSYLSIGEGFYKGQ